MSKRPPACREEIKTNNQATHRQRPKLQVTCYKSPPSGHLCHDKTKLRQEQSSSHSGGVHQLGPSFIERVDASCTLQPGSTIFVLLFVLLLVLFFVRLVQPSGRVLHDASHELDLFPRTLPISRVHGIADPGKEGLVVSTP